MKLIFFGDIVGKSGRRAVTKVLPGLKEKYQPDLVIANGENLAHGMGITEKTIAEGLEAGIDFFTSGNHIFDRNEAVKILEDKDAKIIRPANYPPQVPGQGFKVLPIRTAKLLVVNLMGRVFIKEDYDCPFRAIDKILEEKDNDVKAVLVDFHAEATSESIALGKYLDGRVSAFLGTHTHVPTQDFRIMPKGTAYVTDVGMVGDYDSILGFDKETLTKRYLTQVSRSFEVSEGPEVEVNAIYLEIDLQGQTQKIEKIYEIVEV
ncbi:TIGR00282 family metallophosphoesterase [Patescibacteria group bacterium]|nr:TIGR00282 family metallophosphoesterase [Patescibacteria group bacterium]